MPEETKKIITLMAIWLFFDGKKRDIAGLWCLFTGNIVPIIWTGGLPEPWNKIVAVIAALMMLTGWAHVGQKVIAEKRAKVEAEAERK